MSLGLSGEPARLQKTVAAADQREGLGPSCSAPGQLLGKDLL